MDFLIAVGISVGILAGLWTVSSISLGLLTWAGFLSWASFYACGGKLVGLKTTLVMNFTGVVWGAIIVGLAGILGPFLGNLPALGVAVFFGAGGMCWQAKYISWLTFIPGAFIGCSTYFGSSFDFMGSVIGLICGGVLGYLSEQGGILLAKRANTTEEVKA